jgi:hypothetical protein
MKGLMLFSHLAKFDEHVPATAFHPPSCRYRVVHNRIEITGSAAYGELKSTLYLIQIDRTASDTNEQVV